MTFIERHIRILVTAIFGMVVLRIFLSTEANGLNVDGFQGGFMQYRSWLSSSSEPADQSDSSLANLISKAIRMQRNEDGLTWSDHKIVTGSADVPTDKKSEPANSEKPGAAAPEAEAKKGQVPNGTDGKAEKAAPAAASNPTPAPNVAPQQGNAEKTVLERLGLRRSELDKREEELANREALLQAAEKRLAERNEELKKLEDDLKSRTDQRNAELTSLKPIVTIYETMKPKEAARVFEKLEFSNLLMVATAMNPRKLSEVLAQMDPVLAGKLTKSMSSQNRSTVLPVPIAKADAGNELPDLNSQGTP